MGRSFSSSSVRQFVGRSESLWVGQSIGGSVSHLVGWSESWWVGYSVGWSVRELMWVGQSVDWSVGQLAGRSDSLWGCQSVGSIQGSIPARSYDFSARTLSSGFAQTSDRVSV